MQGIIKIGCVHDDEEDRQEVLLAFVGKDGDFASVQGLSLDAKQARGLAQALLAGADWLEGKSRGDFRLNVECDFAKWR